jgi:ankyrin repeat protein
MRALLEGGADPFMTLPDRTSVILLAAGQGYGGIRGEGPRLPVPTEDMAIDSVRLLLERGADIHSFNDAGNTVLHAAVSRGDHLVKFLVEKGALVNARNKAGSTPLDIASGKGGGRRGPGPVRETTVALLKRMGAE